LGDESDDFIHGFDTFVDQVSETSREYVSALERAFQEKATLQKSSRIKAAIRQDLEGRPHSSPLHRRVRLLLQALGLLDVERLIEHRPPLDKLSFWKRPAVPQLQLRGYNEAGMPILTPLRCPLCGQSIKGSMYTKSSTGEEGQEEKHPLSRQIICEGCYRDHFLGQPEFSKTYKHCILDDVMTPSVSKAMCLCEDVPKFESSERSVSLFPVSDGHKHRRASKPGMVECGMLKLGDIVAEAKHESMRASAAVNRRTHKKDVKGAGESVTSGQASRPRVVTQKSQPASDRVATARVAIGVDEVEADDDIPFYLKRYVEKYPFGNVHMALRIGPIFIENGVAQYVLVFLS
jgi:hypothetical protein